MANILLQDYYEHTRVPSKGDKRPGLDFRREDGSIDTDSNGTYSAVTKQD